MEENAMNILVPLSKQEHIAPYIDAGADELYIGFYDEKWTEKFGTYADINRMSGFKFRANPNNFHQMIETAKLVKSSGKKIFVTMNANGYSADEIGFIEENYFPSIIECGVDGLILSEPLIITSAINHGIAVVASTMCAIYNSDIAGIYRDLGVKRMILPRDLSLNEISKICSSFPDVDFEAFFMRNGCIFSDCYCLGMHRPECGATCTYTRVNIEEYEHNYKDFAGIHDVDVNDYIYRFLFHREACAMCALYKLNEIGIKSLKIVGRADDHESVCQDIMLTKTNIEILNSCSNENEYLAKMKYPFGYPRKCREGFSCYYPEVRFGNN